MKKTMLTLTLATGLILTGLTQAATYKIDTKGAHAAINFKIKHLGYSWLTGRFNQFDGSFNYDPKNLKAASVNIEIDAASVDSNHAERDKHLRGKDFLNVAKFPKATFKSTKFTPKNDNEGTLTGNLTLHGVTKSISFPVYKIGAGKDPWGGVRAGFSGQVDLKLSDYGINFNLGPASTHVTMELYLEGIKQ